ncbi:MAG TPA: sulfatase-like hydrolase/transferase [Thermoguttaceae bacterium]|nr:sulfatase-like hydrolase/transferase [Thermoguttaceae bacterium]
MNAICLVIDRLHVGHLGAYGNAWIETPSIDRLACEAFTFDQAIAPGPGLEEFLNSVWQGRHPLLGRHDARPAADFPRQLAAAGVAATLLTDDPAVAGHPAAAAFHEIIELDPPERIEPADDVDETHLARCFAQILDWLDSTRSEESFLLWVHLSSLGTCWDAPYQFRERYAEPGDPAPPRGADVPSLALPEDFDPDELLGLVQSYAGQVSLLDTCVGALLESLDDGPFAKETLLTLVSARGFPLGEHGRVGECGDALHGELVHVPMMVRLPGGLGAAGRGQALVTPADLRTTLLEWWSLQDPAGTTIGKSLMPIIRSDVEIVRDRLVLGSPGAEAAIRVPAWYMRLLDVPRLFVKPDDRWEVNDVADRCGPVVEELQSAADDFLKCLDSGNLDTLTPISEILRTGPG